MKRIVYLLFVVLASCGVDEIEPNPTPIEQQKSILEGEWWDDSNPSRFYSLEFNGDKYKEHYVNSQQQFATNYGKFTISNNILTIVLDSTVRHSGTTLENGRIRETPFTLDGYLNIFDRRYARR